MGLPRNGFSLFDEFHRLHWDSGGKQRTGVVSDVFGGVSKLLTTSPVFERVVSCDEALARTMDYGSL